MKQILPFLAACLLPFTLFASEASGNSEAKAQEQVFELPVSKMPVDYFKYEVAFFKEMQTDCEFAMLEGGHLDKKRIKAGFIMNLAQKISRLILATAKRKRGKFIMNLLKFCLALAP